MSNNHAVTEYAEKVLNNEIIAGELVRLACKRHLKDLKSGKQRGLQFDTEAADHAIQFFTFLKHFKGEWAGLPLELELWQQFIIGSIFGWKRADGTRRFRAAYDEIARKNGKALALDTPIPTPDGWTTMGDIKAGDVLFDENGRPCYITGATGIQYNRPCYKVTFSNGDSMVADANHEWLTRTRRPWDTQRIWTTREIQETLEVPRSDGATERNHRIDMPKPLKLPDRELSIPPYVLGCWLGDGESSGARLTVGHGDENTLVEIEREGVSVKKYESSNESSGLYGLGVTGRYGSRGDSLNFKLRELGLLGNKHIPIDYLRSSYEQRLDLMQGLMDTDGYVSKAGQCEFTTTSPDLRDGFLELAYSLGLKATLKTDRAVLYGKDCGEKYRIQFWAYKNTPACRLQRKFERQKDTPKRRTRAMSLQVVSVESVGSVPVKCIEVDSPSHLYRAGRTMIPTHNSTMAAGVGLFMFIADMEPGAEVYTAATARDQARITHDMAAQMVKASEPLAKRVSVFRDNLSIEATASKYEPLSADYNTMDGLNVHCAIIDELHAHKSRGVWDVLDTATGSRRQPLIFAITTAGMNQSGICYEQREYAIQVLRGNVKDDSLFAYIATIDEGDDWQDESCWVKANPNLGISVKLDDLRRKAEKAKQVPGLVNPFLNKHLNIWTQQADRWLSLEVWDENAGIITEEKLQNRTCYGGLDLASVSDLNAWVLVFPDKDDPETLDILCRFWVPESKLSDEHNKWRSQYQQWKREGFLQTTPGDAVDYAFIEHQILQDAEQFDLADFNYDRYFQANDLAMRLRDQLGEERVIPFGQGYRSMSNPTKELERRLLRKKLRHGGNPVLRWMADGVAIKIDPAGSYKPDKASSQVKIDGIVALIMALDRAMRHEDHKSIYETRGVLAF